MDDVHDIVHVAIVKSFTIFSVSEVIVSDVSNIEVLLSNKLFFHREEFHPFQSPRICIQIDKIAVKCIINKKF